MGRIKVVGFMHPPAPGLLPVGVDIVHIAKSERSNRSLCGQASPTKGGYMVDLGPVMIADQWQREGWAICVACALITWPSDGKTLSWFHAHCPRHGLARCRRCRCPQCGVGLLLDDSIGQHCSRRYAKKHACGYDGAA